MDNVKTENKFFSAERKSRVLLSVLVAVSLSFILFIVAPLDVFGNNLEEFNFSFSDFALILSLLAVANAALVFSLLFFIPRKGYRVTLAVLIATGLLLVIQQNFLNFNMTSLPGDNFASELPVWQIVVDTLVWLGGYALAVYLVTRKDEKGRVKFTAVILAIMLFAMEFVSVFTVVITSPAIFTDKMNRVGDGFEVLTVKNYTDVAAENNVFYFCVDRFDEEYAEDAYKENPSVFNDLDGFTWYKDHTANYGHTFPGVANMLTNRVYTAESSREEYLNEAYKGDIPLKTLKDEGYNINLYTQPYYAFTEAQNLPPYVSNKGKVVSVKTANKSALSFKMAYFSFYRGLPLLFKKFLTAGSTAEMNSLTIFNGDVGGSVYEGYDSDTREAYRSIDGKDITTADGGKQFSFIHFEGCHDIKYDENWGKSGKRNVIVSVKNSFDIIKKYIAALKEKGVYENATIVITGDHSYAHNDFQNIAEPRLTALFVKRSGDTGAFKTSEAQTSHNDIWATIFDSEHIDKSGLGDGYKTSVFDIDANTKRTRTMIWHTFSLDCDEYYWEITGSGADFNNWKEKDHKHYQKFVMN